MFDTPLHPYSKGLLDAFPREFMSYEYNRPLKSLTPGATYTIQVRSFNDATGFTLIRATNASFTQNAQSVQLGASVVTFTDVTAATGQTYYYELVATSTFGMSAPTPAATRCETVSSSGSSRRRSIKAVK